MEETNDNKAVFLTGAAARISQEVAILDLLMERAVNPLTLSPADTLITGFSSGGLNVSAINASVSNGEFDKDKWVSWRDFLFDIKNENITDPPH